MEGLSDLSDLPSRGNFTAGTSASHPRTYVCCTNTAPPANQVITTDQSASLAAIYAKPLPPTKRAAGDKQGGKRPASATQKEGAAGGAKRTKTTDPAAAGPSNAAPAAGRRRADGAGTSKDADDAEAQPTARMTNYSPDQLMRKTNKELSDLLKGWGRPHSGKKEELIRRILEHQRVLKKASQPS